MIEVIGVKFKSGGKMYYFAPGEYNPAEGSYVVVETARGQECGEVAARRHAVADDSVTAPLKPILRLANADDLKQLEENREYMNRAMKYCQQRIEERSLPMRLVDVECGFDSNKLIFYFTSEGRVDFRELVKDLANAFHVRIELRQIGDRDEAKLLGGLGICGREFCCKGYLDTFQPVSIKMAKEQGLALNPAKISGTCGRLMCCLRYETPVYDELIRMTPKTGSTVILPGETPVRAYVLEANLVTGNLRVKPENADIPITVHRDNVERLQDASRRMTRDDLRERRTVPAKPAAKPETEAPEAVEAAVQKTEEKPDEQKQQRRPKPQKPPKPPRQPKPKAEQGEGKAGEERQAKPKKQPQAKEAEAHALHAEFGEKQQRTENQQVQRRRYPQADMDFTEHRANEQGKPAQAGEQKPPRRMGNNNRPRKKPADNPPKKDEN